MKMKKEEREPWHEKIALSVGGGLAFEPLGSFVSNTVVMRSVKLEKR